MYVAGRITQMTFLALLFTILLAGCGLVRQTHELVQAQKAASQSSEDLQTSKVAYEACLRSADNPAKCDSQKAIYEADLAEYQARHPHPAVVLGGGESNHSVPSQTMTHCTGVGPSLNCTSNSF